MKAYSPANRTGSPLGFRTQRTEECERSVYKERGLSVRSVDTMHLDQRAHGNKQCDGADADSRQFIGQHLELEARRVMKMIHC